MYTSILQKIPVAVAVIFLVISLVTIYFRSKNVTRSEFIKFLKMQNTYRHGFWLLYLSSPECLEFLTIFIQNNQFMQLFH